MIHMQHFQPPPMIYIVSGGMGASGEQLVHTVLAQYPEDTVRVSTVGNVRQPEQIGAVLKEAQRIDGLVVYTLVEPHLIDYLIREAGKMQVQAVNLMGPIIEWVSRKTGIEPYGQPGLYRQLHREYFDRVAAIDYTLAHDDGKSPDGWPQAEAVLVGVSRVGKTPLSVYLAVLGWKVANYPVIFQIPIREELFALNPQCVFGLTIEPGQLLQYRQQRQRQLGAPGASTYTDPKAIFEEVQAALKVFRRGKFTVIDMTDKTIELGADEIIRNLAQRIGK
jgi:[pyruvate, water dikinase]-phosphate phosphotransferase / [pyruvate, water dikinase] kinase